MLIRPVLLGLSLLGVGLFCFVLPRVGTPSLAPLKKISDFSETEPGIAAVVIIRGERIAVSTKGLARTNPDSQITDATNFNIASLAKQFTAYAILFLESKGRLKRTQTLDSFVSELPSWSKSVSLDQLLSQSSGVPNLQMPCILPFETDNQKMVSYLQRIQTLEFQPGSRFGYSNTGYELLAIVIERASGIEFRKFMEDSIFRPLGMNRTFIYSQNERELATAALGFNSSPLRFAFKPLECTNIVGDSGVYTNLNDYLVWLRELQNPTLIAPKVFNEALRGGSLIRDNLTYSVGWSVSNQNGRMQLEHRGTVNGFRNYVVGYPEADSWLVLFSNNADTDRESIIKDFQEGHKPLAEFHPMTVSGF